MASAAMEGALTFKRCQVTDAGDEVPGGTYAALVFPPIGSDYVWELYDNIPCALGQCVNPGVVASATPIPVALGATTPGRNFALTTGGTIRGRVVDAVSSAPL